MKNLFPRDLYGLFSPKTPRFANITALLCVCNVLRASRTHSAILLPSSRLEGCELAVKMTRPPLVWFMSLGFWLLLLLLLSPHSGSGSLGTHAALSPSCSGERAAVSSLKNNNQCVNDLVERVETLCKM